MVGFGGPEVRVTALVSFVGRVDGDTLTLTRGAQFDLPAGVDWLEAGLVTTAPAPHLVGVEHAVDANVVHAERRDAPTNWGEALVSDLDGVGPVTAGLLAEAGIETMAELLATDTPTLAMLARVSPAKAEKWRQRADAIVRGAP